MGQSESMAWPNLLAVLVRALVVGAVSGVMGGALIFFTFGFIGFTGAPLTTRLANGWHAVLDTGLGKGLIVGIYLASIMASTLILWRLVRGEVEPLRARPWLSVLAAVVIILSNLESLRNARGWDLAGMATVSGMALLVWGTVWVVAPWTLRRPPG